MNTKAFILLLVSILALGGSLGGAFVGGMALGRSQGEKASPISPYSLPQSDQTQRLPGQLTQEQLRQLRQRFQGQSGQDGGSMGLAGRGGLTGTIEKIEGDTVTVSTAQGPLQATIGADTIIQKFDKGSLADLGAGVQVTVIGQRGEDGTVEARSILIVPPGGGGLLGGRFFSRDTQ